MGDGFKKICLYIRYIYILFDIYEMSNNKSMDEGNVEKQHQKDLVGNGSVTVNNVFGGRKWRDQGPSLG